MNFSGLLPHVDVEEGKARVMNNLKLYVRLIGKFNADKMSDDIKQAINKNDNDAITAAAHALRGVAANLGFHKAREVAENIENAAKDRKDCTVFIAELDETIGQLKESLEVINTLIA